MRQGFINENCWHDDPIELYVDIDLYHRNNNAAGLIIAYGILGDLKTHNEKIARAAFEAGYDVAHVWPTQMKRNIKDSAWDSFLQSPEYKALVGEV